MNGPGGGGAGVDGHGGGKRSCGVNGRGGGAGVDGHGGG